MWSYNAYQGTWPWRRRNGSKSRCLSLRAPEFLEDSGFTILPRVNLSPSCACILPGSKSWVWGYDKGKIFMTYVTCGNFRYRRFPTITTSTTGLLPPSLQTPKCWVVTCNIFCLSATLGQEGASPFDTACRRLLQHLISLAPTFIL